MSSKEWNQLTDEQKNVILGHQQEFPIKVGEIAKNFGIIIKSATLAAGISGQIKETGGICTIRINRHDAKARQRFTLAHEIAHFLLHSDKLSDGITDDVLYRSSLSNELEQEANRLAADIIMPTKLIKESWANYSGLKVEEKIEKLAKEADVSTTAIKIRLGKV